MARMVIVEAIKRGTVATASGCHHFDPNGVPTAQLRPVPVDAAAAAEKKGLVKVLSDRVTEEELAHFRQEQRVAGTMVVGAAAGRQLERVHGQDEDTDGRAPFGGLNTTAATTLFPADRRAVAAGLIDAPNEREDGALIEGEDEGDTPPLDPTSETPGERRRRTGTGRKAKADGGTPPLDPVPTSEELAAAAAAAAAANGGTPPTDPAADAPPAA